MESKENKPKYSAYGRPSDVDNTQLEVVRKVMSKDLIGLGTEDDYLRQSHLMDQWTCSYCGATENPCAQGECSCGKPRPSEWRDPEQGENVVSGGHRELVEFSELRDVRL